MTPPDWLRREQLDPLATSFAASVWRAHAGRLDDAGRDALARAAMLLVVERARGHGAVHPDDWKGVDGHPELPGVVLPDPDAWRAAVDASPWVGDGTSVTPFVCRADGSLALHRDDVAERELARTLRAMASDVRTEPIKDATRAAFSEIFGQRVPRGPALAGAAALRSRLTVITGGPGTGKTTTVVRILALLLHDDPSLRIAIAAPTGKAASRLRTSIEERRAEVDASVRERVPTQVETVHRLLGYRPHDESYRHDAQHPLPYDVVAVDEASMLDLGLARALVAALGAEAKLILLGDHDQLASVDAGAVLEDLVEARATRGDARSAGFVELVGDLFEERPAIDPRADVFADATVELRENHRFKDQPAIGTLAEALRIGEADAALEAFDGFGEDLRRLPAPERPEDVVPVLDAWLDRVPTLRPDDPDAHLRVVESRLRLLTALRDGPWGVTGLNRLVESRLRARGIDTRDPWYDGRPVMILRNLRSLGLANGDVGVCRRSPEGTAEVVLRAQDGNLRTLPVAALPSHETAWAMTVHKSQGSEFEHVLMVLPPEGHPLATRSLLYTGVTRARRSVTVMGSEAALRAAVEARGARRTGLGARLREGRA